MPLKTRIFVLLETPFHSTPSINEFFNEFYNEPLESPWNGMMWSPLKLAVGDDDGASNEARLVELKLLELSSSSMWVTVWIPVTENKDKTINI